MNYKSVLLSLLLGSMLQVHVQAQKVKPFAFNLVTGIGSSGLDPARSKNLFAINLFNGTSSETRIFQLSGISGHNTFYSGGLHIAGFANLTGIDLPYGNNKELKEVKDQVVLEGIQIAGGFNFVRGHLTGAQLSGLMSISHNETIGLQLSGLANITNKYVFGAQVAGLANVAVWSQTGVQIAGLLNFTKGELEGTQISMFNLAGSIEGKNSMLTSPTTGYQLGIINRSKKMHGYQIGLINISGNMRGTQFGLINIGPSKRRVNSLDGTMIGLLNIGGTINGGIFMNEMFLTNFEFITGKMKNGSLSSNLNKYVLNTVSYSRYPLKNPGNGDWAVGYGLSKLIFNRSSIPMINEKGFWGAEIYYQHMVSDNTKLDDWRLNEIFQVRGVAGIRPYYKVGMYLVARITLNFHLAQSVTQELSEELPGYGYDKEFGSTRFAFWPGFNIGLLVH